ncbi:hypothetical protein Ga0080559_TMP2525 [Salipiger profundus]|uniref:Uncharacterized protein n=1 Tax=Salipiger profundus TaxID=1229727 RepID=A0A1U7D593_9RHOB|nr:hypothetical protein Ga0080559_TMP2525 [Salipiger profundus]
MPRDDAPDKTRSPGRIRGCCGCPPLEIVALPVKGTRAKAPGLPHVGRKGDDIQALSGVASQEKRPPQRCGGPSN